MPLITRAHAATLRTRQTPGIMLKGPCMKAMKMLQFESQKEKPRTRSRERHFLMKVQTTSQTRALEVVRSRKKGVLPLETATVADGRRTQQKNLRLLPKYDRHLIGVV